MKIVRLQVRFQIDATREMRKLHKAEGLSLGKQMTVGEAEVKVDIPVGHPGSSVVVRRAVAGVLNKYAPSDAKYFYVVAEMDKGDGSENLFRTIIGRTPIPNALRDV